MEAEMANPSEEAAQASEMETDETGQHVFRRHSRARSADAAASDRARAQEGDGLYHHKQRGLPRRGGAAGPALPAAGLPGRDPRRVQQPLLQDNGRGHVHGFRRRGGCQALPPAW